MFSPITDIINDFDHRKTGVLITEGLTVAMLFTSDGRVIIVDYHQYGSNGTIVAVSSTAENAINWYAQSFQKYQNKALGNVCTFTWLECL